MARDVMTQLIEHGKVTRGYLGIGIEQMTPALAKQFGLAGSEGTLVTDVAAGSPAAKAGLQRGDVILAINGEAISDFSQLRLHIASLRSEHHCPSENFSQRKRDGNAGDAAGAVAG